MTSKEFKSKIAAIYTIANELGSEFGIDTCTPDGHLLGAIGQIAAKIAFGLQFGSEKDEHNCSISHNGKKTNIQVRSTSRGSIALRAEPEYLVALEISPCGSIMLLFNGPGRYVWEIVNGQKNLQKYASRNQLIQAQSRAGMNDNLPILDNIFSHI